MLNSVEGTTIGASFSGSFMCNYNPEKNYFLKIPHLIYSLLWVGLSDDVDREQLHLVFLVSLWLWACFS